jgi:hypothetical protein
MHDVVGGDRAGLHFVRPTADRRADPVKILDLAMLLVPGGRRLPRQPTRGISGVLISSGVFKRVPLAHSTGMDMSA